jgi:type I restriction enzyme M protein
MESANKTASAVRDRYEQFVELYPEVFITEQDRSLRFSNETIAACVEELSSLRLIDLGVSTIALAFQVLRSEALKQGEGQYFTPQAVIEAGVRLMRLKWEDIIIDPACGTGGFLVEAMLEMQRTHDTMSPDELSRWAQTHIFGIEKDAIGVKLTKAIMQIAGDGLAHCVRGDSVRVHNWSRDFPHLMDGKFRNGRFSVVITNPPFG